MPAKPSTTGTPTPEMHYRHEILATDREAVLRIVESTGFFNAQELLIAIELVDERLAKGPSSGYFFVFAECAPQGTVAYTCYGPVPGSQESYDLYWIAVDRSQQGHGVGRSLIRETERAIAGLGGRRVYIETSSRGEYRPTREFYLNVGYREEALVRNYYARGEHKVIYVKRIPPLRQGASRPR